MVRDERAAENAAIPPRLLGKVLRRVAEGNLPRPRVYSGHGDVVATNAHPVSTAFRLFFPKAQQQDHVLAALYLVSHPLEFRLLYQRDDVVVPQAVIAQVGQRARVHVGDVGAQPGAAGADAVGVKVPGQILGQREGVGGIVVVPVAVGPHQAVGVADGGRWVVRRLEFAIEPPQRIGGGEGAAVRWRHYLPLVKVGHAGGGIVLPGARLPVESGPLAGGDQGAPGVGVGPESAGRPVVVYGGNTSILQRQPQHLEGAGVDTQFGKGDTELDRPAGHRLGQAVGPGDDGIWVPG